ncbi:MAG: methyltransferase domain-containing protein [Ktedonobacteraceae bacterium]|nr:methyltransferase domain-containing protein [Ktedonobacteraceae bacterium]
MLAFSGDSFPSDPSRSRFSNTYIVQDRQSEEELTRLALQDKLLIAVMHGTLPEQKEVKQFERVLDIGCGTGGWAIETARIYPTMQLTGIDINEKTIDYAKEQAASAGVSERVSFKIMDALTLPGLANASFDLVNQRFGSTYLRVWDWPRMMREIARVTRPGGTIRFTEVEIVPDSNSDALRELCELFLKAFSASQHISRPEKTGIIPSLQTLLAEQRCQDIQMLTSPIEYHAGSELIEGFYEDLMHMFRTFRPFIQKWSKIDKDYDTLYQQMLADIKQPDFYANFKLSTIWGRTPG